MKNLQIRSMVSGAIFAALICVSTMFFPVSIGHGFVNIGDCFVILSGCLLGGGFGVAAAAVGASLADILLSYAIYAPATFIIKALMSFFAAFTFNKLRKRSFFLSSIIACIVSEVIMIVGYFTYEFFAFGFGGAAAGVTGNLMQGAVSSVFAILILAILNKNTSIRKFFRL